MLVRRRSFPHNLLGYPQPIGQLINGIKCFREIQKIPILRFRVGELQMSFIWANELTRMISSDFYENQTDEERIFRTSFGKFD